MKALQKTVNFISILTMTFVLAVVFCVPLLTSGTLFDAADFPTIGACPNILLLFVAIAGGAALSCLGKKVRIVCPYRIGIGILLGLVVLAQIVLYCNANFTAGNDTDVLASGAALKALGQYDALYNREYYQAAPNNLYAYALYCLVYRLAAGLGLSGYRIMEVISILAGDCSLLLVADLSHRLTKSGAIGLGVSALFALLYCANPWILIPYTDQLSVGIPVLTLWIYARIRERQMHPLLKTVAIALPAILGYKLKALNLIVLLAIALVELLRQHQERSLKKAAWNLLGLALCILLTFGLTKAVERYTDYTPDETRELGVEWYLLLGSNTDSLGQWNVEDYNRIVTEQMPREERKDLAYGQTLARYEAMGLTGLMRHWANKTNLFFNDATLLFGQGESMIKETEESDNPVGQTLANFFFADESHGRYYMGYAVFLQFVWICILMPFAVMVYAADCADPVILILKVTFTGIFLFFMLFECSPRLLISNIPVFVVGAAYGYRMIAQKVKEHAATER